jgi:hypothetical protein
MFRGSMISAYFSTAGARRGPNLPFAGEKSVDFVSEGTGIPIELSEAGLSTSIASSVKS